MIEKVGNKKRKKSDAVVNRVRARRGRRKVCLVLEKQESLAFAEERSPPYVRIRPDVSEHPQISVWVQTEASVYTPGRVFAFAS